MTNGFSKCVSCEVVTEMSRTNVSLGRVLAAVVWPWPLAAKTRVESQSTACGMLRCRIRGGAGTGTSPGNSVSDDIRM